MTLTRRQTVMSMLFGGGYVGLRTLATGLPASFLLNPRRALADPIPSCASSAKAQFFILSTSDRGDPINANAPGSYVPGIVHPAPPDGSMDPTRLALQGQTYVAA